MKLIVILLLILPNLAFAHDDQPIQQVTNVYNSIQYTNQENTGIASSIAMSQLHFDGSTHRFQLSIGAGNYNSNSALAAGIALKFGSKGPLISGSVSHDSSHTGLGAGITFRF